MKGRSLLAAAAAVGACAQAPAASAATPTHVAIVVTYKGTTVARCAPVKSSGLADLQSRYSVVVGQPPSPYAGFVFTIDGHGTTHPDDTHYWAYYHRVNGAWVYSSVGAASYKPPAGAVEGWAYDNGSSTPPKPPSRTYSSVCGSTAAAPSPAATSAAAPPPAPRTTAAAPNPARTEAPRPASAAHHSGVQPAAPVARASSAQRTAASRARASSHAATAGRARPHAGPGTSGVRPSTTATPRRLVAAAASTAATPRRGGAPPWAPIAALAVIAVLGSGAWWRLRSGGRG